MEKEKAAGEEEKIRRGGGGERGRKTPEAEQTRPVVSRGRAVTEVGPKHKPRADGTFTALSPEPESRRELLSGGKEANWGPGLWEQGRDSGQSCPDKDRLPARFQRHPVSRNAFMLRRHLGRRGVPHASWNGAFLPQTPGDTR